MKSKQRRKANRNFIEGAKVEIRVLLGEALMQGGRVQHANPPRPQDFITPVEFHLANTGWLLQRRSHTKICKKMLSAGLIDRAGDITPKGLEVMR